LSVAVRVPTSGSSLNMGAIDNNMCAICSSPEKEKIVGILLQGRPCQQAADPTGFPVRAVNYFRNHCLDAVTRQKCKEARARRCFVCEKGFAGVVESVMMTGAGLKGAEQATGLCMLTVGKHLRTCVDPERREVLIRAWRGKRGRHAVQRQEGETFAKQEGIAVRSAERITLTKKKDIDRQKAEKERQKILQRRRALIAQKAKKRFAKLKVPKRVAEKIELPDLENDLSFVGVAVEIPFSLREVQ
jgi:hypothetical protein